MSKNQVVLLIVLTSGQFKLYPPAPA